MPRIAAFIRLPIVVLTALFSMGHAALAEPGGQPEYAEKILGLLQSGKPADALKLAEKYKKESPDLPGLSILTASAAFADGKLDLAAEAARASVAKNEQVGPAYNLLGIVEKKQQRYDAALEAFHKAEEADPSSPEPFFNEGETLREVGRNAEAIPKYQIAVRLRPNSLLFPYKLRLAEIAANRGDVLVEEVNKRLKNKPPEAEWILTAAAMTVQQRKFEETTFLLKEAFNAMDGRLFMEMMDDPFFRAYREHPNIAPFYNLKVERK